MQTGKYRPSQMITLLRWSQKQEKSSNESCELKQNTDSDNDREDKTFNHGIGGQGIIANYGLYWGCEVVL